MPSHREAKSSENPSQPSKKVKTSAGQSTQLPATVEEAYRQKCIELKKRLNECEDSNELLVVRNQRLRRGIQRLRLERALLLREIENRIDAKVDDSDGSPSPPPTPTEKPLRPKRPRKDPAINVTRHDSPASPSALGEPYPASFTPNLLPNNDITSSPALPPLDINKKSGSKSSKASDAKLKPKNAYQLFCDKERVNVMEQYPNLSGTEVNMELAKIWQELRGTGQELYFKAAETERRSFETTKDKIDSSNNLNALSTSQNNNDNNIDEGSRRPSEETEHEDLLSNKSIGREQEDQIIATSSGFTAVNAIRPNFL